MEPIGYRKARAQTILEKYDIDLAIATTPENVFYTSGLPLLHVAPNPILFGLNNQYPNISMVRRNGTVGLLNWNLYQSVDKFSWADEHKGIMSPKDTVRNAVKWIKEWDLKDKIIALESTAPRFLVEGLKSKFETATFIEADPAFIEMRLIKTEEEVRRIKKSTEVADKAIMACINASKAGITDNELLKLARQTIVNEGAWGWDHLTMNIGPSDPEAPGQGIAMKPGDISRFDFGVVWEGYVSDISRHVGLSPIAPEAKEIMDRLIHVQDFCIENIKGGLEIQEFTQKINNFFQSLKVDTMSWAIIHSIGLQCEEIHLSGPVSSYKGTFEPNMVVDIEVWENFQKALIGVEDCYRITTTGVERLSTLDRDIFIR